MTSTSAGTCWWTRPDRRSARATDRRPLTPFLEHAADDEPDVGRALAETPHEIWKPLAAKRDVDAQRVAVGGKLRLQVGPDAVEHLKFEPISSEALRGGELDGLGNHGRIMRRDCRRPAALKQDLHQLDERRVDFVLVAKGDLAGLVVRAFDQPHAGLKGAHPLHIGP